MSILQTIIGTNLTISAGGGGPQSYGYWTVEMWIKHGSQTTTYPRVFDVGYWPVESIGYSAEPGGEYFWTGNNFDATPSGNLRDGNWHHLAWCSDSVNLMSFIDGVKIETVPRAGYVVSTTEALSIGASNNGADGWVGFLTNFHIMRGCKYINNFQPSTDPIQADIYGGSEILLKTFDPTTSLLDSSGKNRVFSYNSAGVYFSTDTPLTSGGSLQFTGGSNNVLFPAGSQWALDVV